MFSNDRSELRNAYLTAWKRFQAGQPLQPLETQIAAVVSEHPEYQPLLEGSDAALERDWSAEDGQANPFLHMGMHLAIREQLATDRPEGIAAIYQRLLMQLGDEHAVEHRMMECLGEALWQSQRSGMPPDEPAYLECLRRL